MTPLYQSFDQLFTFIGSIPEQNLFLTVMIIPAVLATGFLCYEVVTKGFSNDNV